VPALSCRPCRASAVMDAGQAARRGLLSWAGEDMGCTASGRDLRYCMSRRVADTRLLTPRWGHPAGGRRKPVVPHPGRHLKASGKASGPVAGLRSRRPSRHPLTTCREGRHLLASSRRTTPGPRIRIHLPNCQVFLSVTSPLAGFAERPQPGGPGRGRPILQVCRESPERRPTNAADRLP